MFHSFANIAQKVRFWLFSILYNVKWSNLKAFRGPPTPVLALDCEYVGAGNDGTIDILARVSIVNEVRFFFLKVRSVFLIIRFFEKFEFLWEMRKISNFPRTQTISDL